MVGPGWQTDFARSGAGLPLERVQHHGPAVHQGGAVLHRGRAGDEGGREEKDRRQEYIRIGGRMSSASFKRNVS